MPADTESAEHPGPAERPVEISGGQGIVVGDYATVFQYFSTATQPLSAHVRAADFAALVGDRTREFVGREFVFRAIDELLAGTAMPSGYIIIRGEPGVGKTAIAAQLVRARGWVHHFNVGAQNIRTARDFLLNVCAQLIIRYRLNHQTLPSAAGEDSGFLVRILSEAADAARAAGEAPVVVMIDALDEAEDELLPPGANRLFLPGVLPPDVYVVVTTREEHDFRLDVDHEESLWIRDEDPLNRADVACYVQRYIDRETGMAARISDWGVEPGTFVPLMVNLSEGNFMYLVHTLADINDGRLTRATVGNIENLPRGLRNYYRRHWRIMRAAHSSHFDTEETPILYLLAAARTAVTVDQLATWSGSEARQVRAVLTDWHEFLNKAAVGDRTVWQIYHRSFADFLAASEDLGRYHRRIADTALAKVPGFRVAAP